MTNHHRTGRAPGSGQENMPRWRQRPEGVKSSLSLSDPVLAGSLDLFRSFLVVQPPENRRLRINNFRSLHGERCQVFRSRPIFGTFGFRKGDKTLVGKIAVRTPCAVRRELSRIFCDAWNNADMLFLDVEEERTGNRIAAVSNQVERGLDTVNGRALDLVCILVEDGEAELA